MHILTLTRKQMTEILSQNQIGVTFTENFELSGNMNYKRRRNMDGIYIFYIFASDL